VGVGIEIQFTYKKFFDSLGRHAIKEILTATVHQRRLTNMVLKKIYLPHLNSQKEEKPFSLY